MKGMSHDVNWNPISTLVNTLRPRQNGRHFPDYIFTCIFVNENVKTFSKISLKFVPKGPINNIPALVQIMAWRRPGDKSLSEQMLVSLPTHICVTRPQWVKKNPNLWNKRVRLLNVVNDVAVYDRATQGIQTSAANYWPTCLEYSHFGSGGVKYNCSHT